MDNDTKTANAIGQVPLDQRISFRLQRIGTLLTTQAVTLLKQACGLTLNQWRLLSFLGERDGGSAHELARLGFIDKATMSRAASELVKRGLIVSEPSSQDRRATLLTLTQEGRQILDAVTPLMVARQKELMDALSGQERDALFATLDKLEATISQSEIGSS